MTKKTILTTLISILSLSLFAQQGNGGISNENESLKLEYVSSSSSVVSVKVTNKDTCTANIRVQWGNLYRFKNVLASSSDTFLLPVQTARFIMAGSVSPCRGYLGIVEIDYLTVVPVTFEYIYVKQVSERIVNVQFKVSETDGTDRFNIQISKDGMNFKTISVVVPEMIQTNKIYNINVKL